MVETTKDKIRGCGLLTLNRERCIDNCYCITASSLLNQKTNEKQKQTVICFSASGSGNANKYANETMQAVLGDKFHSQVQRIVVEPALSPT